MKRTTRPPRRATTPSVSRSKKAVSAADRRRAARIAARLEQAYPDAACSLAFDNPFQLVIATILSAQCTDKRVNMVTGPLFHRWPTPHDLASADPGDVEAMIKSTGFYRAKAKNIRGCATAIVERHGGEVPRKLEDLVKLPGVGRKTANVVLGTAMGRADGIVVDTHVGRISMRLGLTSTREAVKAERELMAIVPKRHWITWSHWLIEHGRAVCRARKPDCGRCTLAALCPKVGVEPRETAAPVKKRRSVSQNPPKAYTRASARTP